jgi:hypothetical protein
MLVIAASGPPAEQSATEVYGTLAGLRLAQRLRACVATLMDFLSRYGATPLTIMAAAPSIPPPPPHSSDTSPTHTAIPVDTQVNAALNAFGVGTLGETE